MGARVNGADDSVIRTIFGGVVFTEMYPWLDTYLIVEVPIEPFVSE